MSNSGRTKTKRSISRKTKRKTRESKKIDNNQKVENLTKRKTLENKKNKKIKNRIHKLENETYIEPLDKHKSNPQQDLIRKSLHSIDEVISRVGPNPQNLKEIKLAKAYIAGDVISMSSLRYQVFKHKGTTCSNCGIKAEYFAKERRKSVLNYHMNLYGLNSSGEEVLMTNDHIIPKSKGGEDTLENCQPMCVVCNNKKSDELKIL